MQYHHVLKTEGSGNAGEYWWIFARFCALENLPSEDAVLVKMTSPHTH